MSLTVRVLFVVTLLLSIVIPFGYFLIGQRTKKRYKRAIGTNIFFFFSTVLIAGIMLLREIRYRQRKQPAIRRQTQQDSDTWQQHFQPVFPASAVVSPLQVQQVRLWVQLVKIPVHLVSH